MKSSRKDRRRAVALASAALIVLGACSSDSPADPEAGAPSASPTGFPPPRELFGADQANLFLMDLASTDIGEIAEPFNFHDIVMTPEAAEVVFMVDAAAPGRPSDNPKDPILFRAPFNDPGAAEVLGEGSEPFISPDGELVAAVRNDEVVVFDLAAASGESEPEGKVVLEGGDWDIVGWTAAEGNGSPRVVAQTGRGIWVADPDSGSAPPGPATRSASPALAVSPTEGLILTGGDSPSLGSLDRSVETKFAFDGAPFTVASWSPDGSTVVARSGEGPDSKLFAISTTGEVNEVQGAQNVGDDIIWMTPSGGYFLYEKINPGKRSDLMQCNPSLQCQNVVSILQAVRILGLR